MATLNLGRIKPVFRGAYAGGTAYVVDDIVTSGDETFICILASTGNATSNATYWTKLAAKGTDGTDGTDVGTTITTQGDILYRDGSGLQRLAKPASDMYLKNTSGGVLSWAAVSSDFVKLYEADDVATASEINFNGYFNDNYKVYKIFGCHYGGDSGNAFHFRIRTGTDGASEYTSGNYYYAYGYNTRNSSGSSANGWSSGDDENKWRLGWCGDGTSDNHNTFDLTFYEPTGTDQRLNWTGITAMWDAAYAGFATGGGHLVDNQQMTGIKFYAGSGNIGFKWIKIYGMK